jgi:hypothetical protein
MKLIYMVDGTVVNADAIISIESKGPNESVLTLQGGKELVYPISPHSLGRELTKAVNSLTDYIVGKKL